VELTSSLKSGIQMYCEWVYTVFLTSLYALCTLYTYSLCIFPSDWACTLLKIFIKIYNQVCQDHRKEPLYFFLMYSVIVYWSRRIFGRKLLWEMHNSAVKVKVHTLDIMPLRSESPLQKRSGMARVLEGSHSFTHTFIRNRNEPYLPLWYRIAYYSRCFAYLNLCNADVVIDIDNCYSFHCGR